MLFKHKTNLIYNSITNINFVKEEQRRCCYFRVGGGGGSFTSENKSSKNYTKWDFTRYSKAITLATFISEKYGFLGPSSKLVQDYSDQKSCLEN